MTQVDKTPLARGAKSDWKDQLFLALMEDQEAALEFLGDKGALADEQLFLVKGYCRNEHILAQAEGFVKLARRKLPQFEHVVIYDNAPSHVKVDPSAPHVSHMRKGDGFGAAGEVHRRSTTMPDGTVQELTMVDPKNPTGPRLNKGIQRVGSERGYWNADGVVEGRTLKLDEMREILGRDLDFASVKSRLEEFYDGEVGFHFILNAKFWCNLAWVEPYWNDVKRYTRVRCDYTMPTLKKNFPIALRVAVAPHTMRNYQRSCFEAMDVLRKIGRRGDFGRYPKLKKQYKSHRCAELIRLGHALEPVRRKHSDWGSILHARRLFGPPPAPMDVDAHG